MSQIVCRLRLYALSFIRVLERRVVRIHQTTCRKYLYMLLINYLDTGTPVLRGLERSLWYTIACLYPVTRVSGNRVFVQTHVNIA